MSGAVDARSRPSVLRLQCPPSFRAVRGARTAVAQFCRDAGHGALAHDAALLTSELMANACRQARGPISVVASHDGTTVSVEVSDDFVMDRPLRPRPLDLDSDSGRGLALVDAIAGGWGTTLTATGKSVWFRLP